VPQLTHRREIDMTFFTKEEWMADLIVCALAQRPNQALKGHVVLRLLKDSIGAERMNEIASMGKWRSVLANMRETRIVKIDGNRKRTYCYTVKTLQQREKEVIARRTMVLPHKDDTIPTPPDI
tara:strand:- start:138 stop:506 length:369 start_codon:yes stop_codon:yes gene_type:complete